MQLKQFLTTNRTDSLQYMALIAAYKACPPYEARTRYLSHSTPDVIPCAIVHPKYKGMKDRMMWISRLLPSKGDSLPLPRSDGIMSSSRVDRHQTGCHTVIKSTL